MLEDQESVVDCVTVVAGVSVGKTGLIMFTLYAPRAPLASDPW